MNPQSRLFFSPVGPAAAAALRALVRHIQGEDPLAPVTVVGPSTYANLALRRELGRAGFANVGFMAWPRLADLLGGPRLAAQGLRPLAPIIESRALRQAVGQTPGPLNQNGYHPATHQTLKRAIRELAQLSPEQKAAWQRDGSELTRQTLHIDAAFRELTKDYYNQAEDLARAAAAAVRQDSRGNALTDLGFILFFQLRRVTPGQRELIAALAAADRCAVFLPWVDDPEADGPAQELAARLTAALGPAETLPAAAVDESVAAAAPAAPPDTRLLIAQDAAQEIRWVIRSIFRQLADGVPLRRIAILYRQAFPYGALIPEELALAGLPMAGPDPAPLSQTAAGRALTGLLALAQGIREGNGRELPREEVAAWLTSCPLRFPGGLPQDFNPSQWDSLSQRAGIIRGLAQWQDKLRRFANDRARDAARWAEQTEVSEAKADLMMAESQAARQLAGFITGLAAALTPPADNSSWAAFSQWAGAILERYGPTAAMLSDAELNNLTRIRDLIGSLAELDPLESGGGIDFAVFRQTLEEHLTATPGHLGAMGQGVFVGPVSAAAGLSFDAVHLVGLVEGAFPPPLRAAPLLPESETPAGMGNDWRPSRAERLAEERHNFLAALAAADTLQTLSYPIADAAGQRENYPSRWFLEQATRLEGIPIRSSTLKNIGQQPWLTRIGSPEQDFATQQNLAAADDSDYDLASLWEWRARHDTIRQHPLAATGILAGALQVGRGRYSPYFSPWNGNLSGAAGGPELAGGLSGQILSPTGLERWATCPFSYFLGQQLRLSAQDRPEDLYSISPLEQGSLVHEILEKFIRQARENHTLPPPGQEWRDSDKDTLREIAEKAFQAAEGRGITGRPLLWRMAQADIMDDLMVFLEKDAELRAKFGASPAREEARFGIGGDPAESWAAAVHSLPDGSEIRFRGVIDRVDISPDGREVLVLDYKSGGSRRYAALDQDTIDRGKRLQLSIYSLAARQALGAAVKVRAAYWFVSSRGQFQWLPEEPVSIDDPAVRERFDQGIAAIAAGIRGGVFPANPGTLEYNIFMGKSNGSNCHYCDFDSLCPARRTNLWQRLKGRRENQTALAAYLQLAEPEEAGE